MKNNYLRQVFNEVFSRKKYILLALIFSFLIFSLFITLNNFSMFISAFKLNPKLIFDVYFTVINLIYFAKGFLLFNLLILLSLLAGLNIALIVYKLNYAMPTSSNTSIIGFVGILGGALSSGCSACTLPLISILGISGSFAILPLKGEEFTILAIILLSVSLYMTSKSIAVKTCGTKFNKLNKYKKTKK